MTNILIVGSGAREHAIVKTLMRSSSHPTLFCCASSMNPGVAECCKEMWIGDITDCETISQLATQWQIDFAVIGPEAPLEKGLADKLAENGIPTIGPKKQLAKIETSKAFARDLMQKYHIEGLPRYRVFSDLTGVEDFLAELKEASYVIKANGLMGGKGVKIAPDHLASFKEALDFCREIIALGQTFVIEEKLIGQEFSALCFCDGEHIVPMPLVQDHKRAYVDDKGPNTGGMGSYSDANHSLPFLTEKDVAAAQKINAEVMHALENECGEKYVGILYGSFIATARGIYVIEFNARFGDPESLNVLTILESDFVAICEAMISKKLSANLVFFAPSATVCKYAVPEGYPDKPLKNASISIDTKINNAHLYLGAVHVENGKLLATGSRTAAVVGVAKTLSAAEKIAEAEISFIQGRLFHREDIGTPELIAKRVAMMQALREKI